MRNISGWVLVACGVGIGGCSTAQTEPRSADKSASEGGYQAPQSSEGVSRFAQAPPEAYSDEVAHESPRARPQDSGNAPKGEGYGSQPPSSAAPARRSANTQSPREESKRRDSRAEADSASGAPRTAWESAPAPSYRPGLATRWGETHTSRVSSAPFERDNESSPFLTARLFYNNAAGIQGMLDRRELSVLGQSQWNGARGTLSVRVVSERGRDFPAYRRGSDLYVTGREGERYLIEVKNNSGSRYEAVATVDGLDVIDGQSGSFEKRGYLVGPWATVQIDGFRQSESAVAAFRFGGVGESYAASKGDDRNVGVIGVAFFDEIGARVPSEELEQRRRAEPFPGQYAEPPIAY